MWPLKQALLFFSIFALVFVTGMTTWFYVNANQRAEHESSLRSQAIKRHIALLELRIDTLDQHRREQLAAK